MRRFGAVLVVLLALAAAVPPPAAAGEPVWGKDLVAGKRFPLPFGVSAVYFEQDQEYVIDSLTLGVPGLPPIPGALLEIDNQIEEVNAKFDAWLLPYLNVFAIAGQLDGETAVNFARIQPLLGLPFSSIDIEYDGDVFGLGAVLAGGSDRYFGSLTAIATQTSLDGNFDSDVEANVLTPRFGMHSPRGALYVGGMYLDAQEKHSGTISLPLVPGLPAFPVPFEVELSQKEDWNWLVGGVLSIGERWTLQVEGGFEGREHIDVELGYRF